MRRRMSRNLLLAVVVAVFLTLAKAFTREDFDRTIAKQKEFSSKDYLAFARQYSRAWLDGLIPTATGNVSAQCKLDSIAYRDALASVTSPWALEMFDATGKLPDGILNGNWHALGDYEQCLRIRPDPAVGTWRGKYCQVGVSSPKCSGSSLKVFLWIVTPEQEKMFNLWFFNLIASGAPVDPEGQTIISIQQPSLGVCLPSSCSAEDITNAMTGMASGNTSVGGLGFTSTTMESFCSVDNNEPYTPDDAAVAMLTLLAALSFCILIGTLLDVGKKYTVLRNTEGPFFRVFQCFSVLTNCSKLLSTKSAGDNLSCIHGLRFISFTWVLLGHAYALTSSATANYGLLIDQALNSVAFQAISNSYLSVDSFFFITGLLLAFLFLRAMKKTGTKSGLTPQVNPAMLIVHRFLRLTPAYALIIGFYVTIWPKLGDGPSWYMVEIPASRCGTEWWANLLYIQNFVYEFQGCLAVTWYLAVEFQIFVPATVFVWLMYRYDRFGVATTVIVTLFGCILGAVFMIVWDMPPANLAVANSQFAGVYEYNMYYYKMFWFRYPPFFIGMLFGWILYKVKQTGYTRPYWLKPHLARVLCVFGWLVAGTSAAACLYGMYDYSNGDPKVPQEVQIIYGGFHRAIWAICLGWVVFACDMGYGGPINAFLSWKLFVVLGRLTFCAYLIHLDWITFYLSFTRSPFYYTNITMAYSLIGHVVVTLALATVATLAFEAPFLNLEKMLFNPYKAKTGSNIPGGIEKSSVDSDFVAVANEKQDVGNSVDCVSIEKGMSNPSFESDHAKMN